MFFDIELGHYIKEVLMIIRFAHLSLLMVVLFLGLVGCNPPGTVSIVLDEFSITPETLKVKVGDELILNVSNTGSVGHNITIFSPDGKEIFNRDVKSKDSTTFEFQPLVSGEFLIVCLVPGHQMAGMKAKIVVSP
jgi:plastocyanin